MWRDRSAEVLSEHMRALRLLIARVVIYGHEATRCPSKFLFPFARAGCKLWPVGKDGPLGSEDISLIGLSEEGPERIGFCWCEQAECARCRALRRRRRIAHCTLSGSVSRGNRA